MYIWIFGSPTVIRWILGTEEQNLSLSGWSAEGCLQHSPVAAWTFAPDLRASSEPGKYPCSCRVCKLMFPSIPRILAMQSFQISQQNRMEFLMKDIVISSPSSTLLKTISSTTCWSSRGNIVRFAVITSFPPFKAEKLIIFRRLFGNSLCLDARAGAVLQTSDHCCSRLCLPHLLSAIQPWKIPWQIHLSKNLPLLLNTFPLQSLILPEDSFLGKTSCGAIHYYIYIYLLNI